MSERNPFDGNKHSDPFFVTFFFKVAPSSKLAVRSLSTSMARASQFRNIPPKKLY